MNSNDLFAEMATAIDDELHSCIDSILGDYPKEYTSILMYQLGWEGEMAGKEAQGKRIRPLLVLLACHAAGGIWKEALPAAASMELMHNFSLIHDDIQDCSATRRGRPTVWKKWGIAQAINAGDAMLSVAHLCINRLSSQFKPELVNKAVWYLQDACLRLTRGQYLDIAFENQTSLPLSAYWQMVEGKTSSLLAASLALGVLTGSKDALKANTMLECGRLMGMAFQVQDDWLGIWGNVEITGKSITSDLINKKKTYPILIGLDSNGEFSQIWNSSTQISESQAKKLADLLIVEGSQLKTQKKFEELYQSAFDLIYRQQFDEKKLEPLEKTLASLFGRIK